MAVIYRIIRVGTDQCYVGHSVELARRWSDHRSRLQQDRHHSPYLQRAWNKYGEDAFAFEVIEECLDEDRVVREQYHMDLLNSCFNSAPAAGTMLGYRFTDEQRARCGVHRIGFKENPEATESRLAAARKSLQAAPYVWITDGIKNKRHPVAKSVPVGWYEGRTFSEEHRAAVLAATGPRSDEAKAKMRTARLKFVEENPDRHEAIVAARLPYTWYTDGNTSKQVLEGEIPPEGWRRGQPLRVPPKPPTVPHGIGMRWITDGVLSRKVAPGAAIPDGWTEGRTLSEDHMKATLENVAKTQTPEARAKGRANQAALIANTPPQVWITDGTINRKIDATAEVPDGWTLGHTLSANGLASTTEAAKLHFTSEEATRRVKMAWENPSSRAALMASRADQCWITNGSETKRHSKSEPIPEGWRRGRGGVFGRAAAKAKAASPQDKLFPD